MPSEHSHPTAIEPECSPKKESGARSGLTPLKKIPPPCYSPTKEIRSTIADVGLNFRVRNGNGCGPHSKGGGKTFTFSINWSKTNRQKGLCKDLARVTRRP